MLFARNWRKRFSSMSKSKELAKNTIIMLFGKILTQFLSFLLLPLYTHLITKEAFGTVDLISTYISIMVPVSTIQLEMAAFRYLIDTRIDELKQSVVLKTVFRDAIRRLLFVSAMYLIIVQFVDFEYKYIALVCGVTVAFSNLLLQISRGLGKNVLYTIASVIAGAITIIANLVMICAMNFGAESILISMAIANTVCATFLFVTLRINKRISNARYSKDITKSMLKYSWPLVPNGISWWLIGSSDRTIVSIALGVAANGVYAVACKFPNIVSGFIGVFSYTWTESASLHIDDDDRDEFFSSIASNALRIFSSIGICVIAILPLVFDIIVGRDYREAYEYIPMAVLAVVFNSLVLVYSAVYVAKKLTKKVAMTSIISAVINIIIDLMLINVIGLHAAVLSTALAYAIMTIYRHFDVKKYVNIKYKTTDIILAILGFGVVIIMYHINNPALNVTNIIVAVAYTLLQTRNISSKMLKKLKIA